MEAGPSESSKSNPHASYVIGTRYLHAKTRRPLTLLYIGPLAGKTAQWLGVEYDDPAHGRGHSGTHEGVQVFQTKQEGAGAFVKYVPGSLIEGPTFIEALEERYGQLIPAGTHDRTDGVAEKFVLGGSSIVVEAPGLKDVESRINRLERLREVGVENEWVRGLGGDEDQRTAMKQRLKGVHTLNISGNLLNTWNDISEIMNHLVGLKTLVLNDSRIASVSITPKDDLARMASSLKDIEDLHLGSSGLSWEEIVALSPALTHLKVLHLNDNPISAFNVDPRLSLPSLVTLSLRGCPIMEWEALAEGLAKLTSLQTLDISSLPFTTIPRRTHTQTSLRIPNVILHSTCITTWIDINGLYSWTGETLQNLKIFLLGVTVEDDEDEQALQPVDPLKMSRRPKSDRPMLIAKLSGLVTLNSSPVTSAERRDAEMWYLSNASKQDGKLPDWERCEELRQKYGYEQTVSTKSDGVLKPAALKSKMIALRIISDTPALLAEISVLPSAPISLLRRKVLRALGDRQGGIRLWTVNEAGERVAEVEDAYETSWWFRDGDDVLLQS